MTALSVQPPYPIFTDSDGTPLEDGYIWIGQANLDPQVNPVSAYWDAALTQLAGQPIRTTGGYPSNNGTPARIYVNSNYSIRVSNKNGAPVYSAQSATERYDSSQIAYDPPFSGSVQRTLEDKISDVVSVKDFGATGDGITFDTDAIKAAIDYAIANGKSVYVPSGTYICTYNVLLFTFSTSTTKTFCLFGDGASSILKMGDGLVGASNRRFFDMRPSVNMDAIEIKNILFDNNARNSPSPPSPYDYEQSHTLRFAGASGTTTKLLKYSGVIVKDPVADGMNNQGTGIISNWVIENCSEIDRTRVRSSIQQSYMAENLCISCFTGDSIESEPTAATTSIKNVFISNSTVSRLDMAGRTGYQNNVCYHVSNCKVSTTMALGYCRLMMNNCEINIGSVGRFNYIGKNCLVSDTIFNLDYDSTTGAVVGIDIYGLAGVEHDISFDNCKFIISYDGSLPVPATGYLVKSSLACPVADVVKWNRKISNSYFDPRAASSVYCYRNGSWVLENNVYACATLVATIAAVFHTHGGPTYGSNTTITGGDFRNVVGYGIGVSNTAGVDQEKSSLTLDGTMLGEAACNPTKFGGGTLSANDSLLNNSRIVQVETIPSYGLNGDTVALRAGNVQLGYGIKYSATATSDSSPNYVLISQKGIKKNTTINRPSALPEDVGLMYFDTTLDADGKPIWFNGAAWVDATGAVV